MAQVDKIDKIIGEFLSEKFEEWKPFLNRIEQAVFVLRYFKHYSIVKISNEIYYSERSVKRYLKSAKRKINRLIP